MKRDLFFSAHQLSWKMVPICILSFMLTGFIRVNAEVQFTQTTNADFNKGVKNNVVVGSDNVYLQFDASDVGTWLTTTVLPATLSGHKMVSWNDNYVFLVGGYNGTSYSNAVYKATIQAGGITSWTTMNSLPAAMKDVAVVVGTNTIYVLGGRDGSQAYNTIYYASIAADGTIGTWQTSAVTLPANRWGHTAVYLNGYIYVAGGASTLTETEAVNIVYYTQVLANNTLSAFSTGTVLPATRNKHSMVTYNSRMYVLGGYANGGTRVSTVYYATPGVDGSTGSWSTETALPLPISNHSSVVSNGLIMVLAGENNTTLSNTVYYADADAGSLTWITSPNVMYDYTKDGAAFAGNGIVICGGGTNLSGFPIHNCRYANLTLTSNYVNHGVFVSVPFYELGAERLIDSLKWTATYNATFANCQVSYRTAPSSGVWGNWTAPTSTTKIVVSQTKQYLQYKVLLTGQTTYNVLFHEMNLYTPGTQLNGNLNGITTFTQALSPYWATSDISFTAGTHTFQAGTIVLFLPETGLSVGQANVICNGTVSDSVKFLYYTSETGKWDGIYFDPNSDNGVSSQFYYTVIANAGFGSNNANLYCDQANEPLLTRCSIRNADGNGLRLNSAHVNLNTCLLKGNTENGIYINNSNPTIINCIITYNLGAGIYLTSSASQPTYSSTTISNNLCGFRYPSPNDNFYQPDGSPTVTGNTYNGIAIDGGSITSNRTWNSITYPYILLGSITIQAYNSSPRLTIEPGNIIQSLSGVQIKIGAPNYDGGELYALGTWDSLITFTAWNSNPGGWNGIYFTDQSDYVGGQSQMDYCVIEKGNDYNFYSVNTNQPNIINHSKIQNSLVDGARIQSYYGTIQNCQLLNNGRYPLYYMNPAASPTLNNNIYTGNVINRIALSGGDYNWNRTILYDGVPYYILSNIRIISYNGHPRLTIKPGVTLEFATGTNLQVGGPNYDGGEIYAVGKTDSIISFKAYNNTSGGWNGILFTDQSDYAGSVSTLKYCTVQQGASYNINCENTVQPTLDSCIISNSASHGMIENASSGPIHGCQFQNNAGYPLYFQSWNCNSHLRGNTYSGNTPNYIALSGGSYSSGRTIYYDGIPYHVLDNIYVTSYNNHPRLTVQPGVTLAFASGKKLQLGEPNYNGGEIYAVGKSDSLIIFTAYNNTAGGWEGFYFTDQSDYAGSVSTLDYCVIKLGNNYNIYCENTTQPAILHGKINQSLSDGLRLYNSTITIQNSLIASNGHYGLYLSGNSAPTLGNTSATTNNFFNNTSYELYHDGTSTINARYNYWGTGDSTMVAERIYDYYDNTAKGKVYFGPFAQVPSLLTTNTSMSGTVTYNNIGANPIKNSPMVIKNFAGTTIASTSTNTSGVYSFTPFVSGNYQMFITPSAAWGGVNSTDALGILNHFAHITLLTGMNMAAADVNLSRTINAGDALYVMKRYTGAITSFPAGDYLWHTSALTVSGSTVTNTIKMLCFGDVNSSYAPTLLKSSSIILVYNGNLPIQSFDEFDFPVKIKKGEEVGAISLGFYYPEEYLEIVDVQLPGSTSELIYHAEEGLLRMAWCDLNPISFGDDDVVVIIKMKAKDLQSLTSNIELQLYEDCEFADRMTGVYGDIILEIPTIQAPIGMEEQSAKISVSVFPNPSRDETTVSMFLKQDSKVTMSLYNQLGVKVKMISEKEALYAPGNHKFGLNTTDIPDGIYYLDIEYNFDGQWYSKTVKVVVIS